MTVRNRSWDIVVSRLEKTMGSVAIVVTITLGFAVANLLVQLFALETMRQRPVPAKAIAAVALEHPFTSRIDGMPRTRTNRRDLQRAIGHDFAAQDVEQSVWPREPRK
jgi:hypothetical protein